MEFGPAEQGMGGAVPVSWREIEAWQRVTNTQIPGWEALILRELSEEYCGALARSTTPNTVEPALSEDEARQKTARDFRAMVNQMKDQ